MTVSPSSQSYSRPSFYWPEKFKIHFTVWIFALVVAVLSWVLMPNGGQDWANDIGPAVRNWWPAPWSEGLPLLPWAAMLLSPLGGLSDRLATALLNGISVIVYAMVIKYLGGPDWLAIFLLLTPSGYWLFRNGQTDSLILGGLLFFNGFDLLILVLKPQVAVGAVVSRLKGAEGHRLAYLLPLVIVVIASLVVWWGWPWALAEYRTVLLSAEWNASTWPYGIVVGLVLLWFAWKTGDDKWGIAATPFLFPYVNWPSYLSLLAVVGSKWPRWTVLVLILLYVGFAILFLVSR